MDIERPSNAAGRRREFVSDAIADVLRQLDFPYVPLTPGSSFRGLHDSLINYAGNERPQMILCLHEEVAISIAHGWSKATGRPCPAIVHDLVGLMHGSMAVYNAFCDQAPVVLLGGAGPVDTSERRYGDWLHSARTQSELVREFVRWTEEPTEPAGTVAAVLRAHQFSTSAPFGPTYVSIDMGLQERRLEDDFEPPDPRDFRPAPPLAADPELVARAAQLLASAERPVIVGGRVAHNPASTPLLVELVELLGAGYHDDRNLVAFPTAHRLNCTGDNSLMREADVLLLVDVVEPMSMVPEGPGGPTVIDLSYGDLRLKSWSNAFAAPARRDVQLLTDPMVGLRALVGACAAVVDPALAARRAAVVEERATALRARQRAMLEEHYEDRPIFGGRLISELWEAVRDLDWYMVLRNTRNWHENIWQYTGAGQYLGHSGGGGVGYGPGAAVGGALAARDRGQFAVGIIGDGDLVMANTALWTACHYRIPMLLVVNDNHSFYNDEGHQRHVARHRERPLENAWIGIHIDDPALDFAGLARSYGAWAEGPVEDPGELKGVLAAGVEAAQSGRVALVHAITQGREY